MAKSPNPSETFNFDNGIRVFRKDLTVDQISRYADYDVCHHEPVEESWFTTVLSKIEQEPVSNQHPVFVDVGSALGYYSLLFIKQFPNASIFAVDPHPLFQERMRQTFELNGYSKDAYTLIPYAVYPHGESVTFALREFGSHIVQGEDPKQISTPDSITVEVRKLSDILSQISGPIDLVKFDIQAAELAVFNKNKDLVDSGRVKYWIVGTHGPKIHDQILVHLSRKHKILFNDPSPMDQTDGLIIAEF